ncbi:MAG: hypothetical protein KGI45_02245 [Patescibacteria group bacterium]|nr:hypothetical protein [Patescibacteria group bacterium]MDE1941120.1 hypothetical protein [Patescibacteria group bacterium]MDE1966872.1 hypothetical protein [Patescibacteria group bacterium]
MKDRAWHVNHSWIPGTIRRHRPAPIAESFDGKVFEELVDAYLKARSKAHKTRIDAICEAYAGLFLPSAWHSSIDPTIDQKVYFLLDRCTRLRKDIRPLAKKRSLAEALPSALSVEGIWTIVHEPCGTLLPVIGSAESVDKGILTKFALYCPKCVRIKQVRKSRLNWLATPGTAA